jgi:hypothetical protein
MKVPNKIPTRLYGRRAMGPSAGGTIWGGAFSPTRGFPATFPAAVPQTEQAEEVPSPENAPPVDATSSIADGAIVPGIITPPAIEAVNPSLESTTPWEAPVTEVHQPAVPLVEPVTEANQPAVPIVEPVTEVHQPAVPLVEPVTEVHQPAVPLVEPVTEAHQPAIPLVEPVTEANQPAVPLSEPEGEAVPNFVPATPVPYQPEHINGFKTELNADGTRSISINNSRITIPDLDILASIPD